MTVLNHYCHGDCAVEPGIEWKNEWDCACNDQCPACGVKDIEPHTSEDANIDRLIDRVELLLRLRNSSNGKQYGAGVATDTETI